MSKYFSFLIILSGLAFLTCKPNTSENTEATDSTESVSEYSDINVAQFKAKMGEPNTVILDVRTPEEVAAGKIKGALEIDFYNDNFEQKVTALDKSKTYLVYCKVGGRSGSACEMMQKAGFPKLYNLDGGWTAWSQSN